jgi:putative ABC transport system ATP-binding protein
VKQELIRCEDLRKVYLVGDTEVHALAGVDLVINKGEYVAIMGASGSGKSTMMNMLGCLDTPSSGSYFLDGEDVSTMTDNELADIRNRKVGFVFQVFNLLARMTARRNIELPLVYAGIPAKERHTLAGEVLKRVGLGHRLSHKPNELSGGERQRVAIARALVNNPSLILADEPTGNLDSKTSVEIMGILQEIHEQGNTILLVTHEADIAKFAKRVVRLSDGKVVSDEPNPSQT